MAWIIIGVLVGLFAVVALAKAVTIVPHQTVFIVERLGKYKQSLDAGFHLLIPFVDRIAYVHTLKEQAVDVPPQMCITRDNIAVEVDGVLYLQVLDPYRASYGINDYLFATTQIAQTTMRSEVGKLDLDRTFEEREKINGSIVAVVDEASDPWGIKVNRYEIKNISPPQSIRDAMEKQMRAEREKRAVIAEAEGDRQARINRAEGERAGAIAESEGERQRRINVAEGHAQEILKVAAATAEGLRKVAEAIRESGGADAVSLRIAEQYIAQFGNLAREGNTLVIPANLSDVAGFVATLSTAFQKIREGRPAE